MTDLAPTLRKGSFLDGRLFNRGEGEWSVADWVVGLTSVALALGSASFFTVSYVISVRSPDFFQQAAIANMPEKLDAIATGSVNTDGAIPAPQVVRSRALMPGDYQIVMVFQNEALLATRDELMRVKVGSVLPGLGTIRTIAGSSLKGGTVIADNATLNSLASATP
ncbi:hypothetical protein [Aureimonas sp. AU12]|uniref:hypothetical protein n=1 Tax=Aureimonas sp. AU12 TaxID=1638161 RepID=UPI00078159A5|nr:hypothetical protein [Aureimonas sp. AU12]